MELYPFVGVVGQVRDHAATFFIWKDGVSFYYTLVMMQLTFLLGRMKSVFIIPWL